MAVVEWSKLPELAVLTVARHLEDINDVVAFSHVNRHYRKTISDCSEVWSKFVKTQPFQPTPKLIRLADKLKPEYPDACRAKLLCLVLIKTRKNFQNGECLKVDELPFRSVQESYKVILSSDLVGVVWLPRYDQAYLHFQIWRYDDQKSLAVSFDLRGDEAEGESVSNEISNLEIFGNVVVVGLGYSL